MRAITWMDGANAQMKSTTSEDNLKKEENVLQTFCCTNSSGAGSRCCSKLMKRVTKDLEKPNCSSYHFVHEIEDVLRKLENGEIS